MPSDHDVEQTIVVQVADAETHCRSLAVKTGFLCSRYTEGHHAGCVRAIVEQHDGAYGSARWNILLLPAHQHVQPTVIVEVGDCTPHAIFPGQPHPSFFR